MKYNQKKHKRRSIRLKGYDYSRAGLYFITICCKHRACLFGKIVMGNNHLPEMILNDAGKMVEKEWLKLPRRFNNIKLHDFVVMPNHFHAILEIVGATLVVVQNGFVTPNGMFVSKGMIAQNRPPKERATTRVAPTIGGIVGAFESIVTVQYIRGVKQLGWKPFNGKLWQRNYYEHIIRNKISYQRIAKYIRDNPRKWHADKFFKN